MTSETALPSGRASWALALGGLAVSVFAVVALTGPGRIDIVDGQTRFDAGLSLVEHGDTAIRDPRIYFSRFPGRDGLDYTNYRFPQTLVAAASIAVTDATGPATEGRRHFVFSLHGAVACALIAVLFAVHFRRAGLSPRAAVGWAAAGIFCTPCWYYGTSTFDDILGSLCAVAAVVTAARAAADRGFGRVLVVGLLLALAYNCKPPLAAFLLPALALADNRALGRSARLTRAGLLTGGTVLGDVVYRAYDWYKFPPEVRPAHLPILENYPPMFFGNPAEALLDFAVGPSSGCFWYFPPLLLCLYGLAPLWARDRRLVWTAAAAVVAFVGFVSLITFYKGDPTWGPRYLTPLFAAGWLLAPAGAALVGRRTTVVLLGLGLAVQLLGLTIDPQRLYVERRAPSDVYRISPWLHFEWELSHLPNRPRELYRALTAPPAPEFTPAGAPTFAPVAVEMLPGYGEADGPTLVARYQVYTGLRFWWASYAHLSAADRPVPVGPTAAGLVVVLVLGLLAVRAALSGRPLKR